MDSPTPQLTAVGVWLSDDTDNGRGILRGLAQLMRPLDNVHVMKLPKSRGLDPAALRARGVRGVIAAIDSIADLAMIERLPVPVVNISGRIAARGIPTVNTDDGKVGRWAARHFLDRGYRCLAYCGNELHVSSRARRQAMEAEARAAGASFAVLDVPAEHLTSAHPRAALARLERWLQALPKPCGIFVYRDEVSLYLSEACIDLALPVPDEVALLGVGLDSIRAAFSALPLSSIDLNAQRIGVLAGEMLLALLAGRPPETAPVLVSPLKIMTRQSSDRYAVADDLVATALEFIAGNLGQPITVPDIVRAARTSRRRLEERFRSALGRSIYEEVQRRRDERAITLMAQPDLTLDEIACAAGFRNGRHLSVAFRARRQITPTEFRERLLAGALAAAS